MKKRITVPADPFTPSREEAEGLAGDITENILAERKLQVRMDLVLAEIRTGFEKRFAKLTEDRGPMVATLQRWADANVELFGKKKSMELLHATVGWQTGQPQLKPLKGWTFAKVLAEVRRLRWRRFLRVKVELDKERIIASRARLGTRAEKIGVRIVQEETFFVDPKVEDLAARQEKEAA